jgi:hypothetical protein
MTIEWGGLPFTAPAIFNGNVASKDSGVYVIMTKPDPQNKPQTYDVLYFGETENFSKRLDTSHEKILCWKRYQINGLYYSLYIMSGSPQDQRQSIKSLLIKMHNSSCNNSGA